MSENKNGSWRYQAVYVERNISETEKVLEFSVCEVYLDKDDKLEMWTENSKISPSGETIEELISDLQSMTDDVSKWKPVLVDSMKIGMGFEKTE